MKNKNILLRALLTGMLCITSLTIFTGCIDKKDGDGMVNGRTADGELPENGDDEPVPIKANKAGKPEIKDSSTTEESEQPEEPETTPKPEKKEETEEQKAEKSLEAFRQSMEGTLQNFGVAFLGEVDESYADRIPEWIEENFPDFSEEYPFVKMIPEERIIGNEIGQLFCVVPRSGDDPVEIIEQRMNFETFEMDEVGQLYSSETHPANGKENVLITLQEVNELLANKKLGKINHFRNVSFPYAEKMMLVNTTSNKVLIDLTKKEIIWSQPLSPKAANQDWNKESCTHRAVNLLHIQRA